MHGAKREYFDCLGDHEMVAITAHEMVAITANEDKDWGLIELAIWSRGMHGTVGSWKYRLRHIWKILTTGTPYLDQVIFDEAEFLKFKNFISNIYVKDTPNG